jgi:hypothetical protein
MTKQVIHIIGQKELYVTSGHYKIYEQTVFNISTPHEGEGFNKTNELPSSLKYTMYALGLTKTYKTLC